MNLYKVERVVLPSALRRGRMATAPVWRVAVPGALWQFQTRKAAQAFAAARGCPHSVNTLRHCWECGGRVVMTFNVPERETGDTRER